MLINDQNAKQLSNELELHLFAGMELAGSGTLCPPCRVYPRVTLYHSDLGGHSYIMADAEVGFTSIGNYVSIATGFMVGLGHPMNLLTASPVAWRPWMPNCPFEGQTSYEYECSHIGSDVWIGAKVIVKAGVTIGNGAIIGAGSVVTRDIPPFTVAAGNPCKVIRDRFLTGVRERIERSRWYDHDWRDEFVDWRSPESALESMEKALAAGFNRGFRRIGYEATDTSLNLKDL